MWCEITIHTDRDHMSLALPRSTLQHTCAQQQQQTHALFYLKIENLANNLGLFRNFSKLD